MPNLREVKLPNVRQITIDLYVEDTDSLHIAFVAIVDALRAPRLQTLTIKLALYELRTQEFDWTAAARMVRAFIQPAASARDNIHKPLVHIQVGFNDWDDWNHDDPSWPIQTGLADLVRDGLLVFECYSP